MKATPISTTVLCWPKRLLSADDLRRHLTRQGELVLLPNTVVTPLAADELRAKGVRISWQMPTKEAKPEKLSTWIYAQEKRDTTVTAAIHALEREGITLAALDGTALIVAKAIVAHGHLGGVFFSDDPATACCIANKIAGIRAAAVFSVPQVIRGKKTLGANLFAIEMPGRTFFELRQMLKAIVTDEVRCSDEVAKVLKELDGHAHR